MNGRYLDIKVAHDFSQRNATIEWQRLHKIFVKNLPIEIEDSHLRESFSKYGEISKAYVIYDQNTKISRRFGFVEFVDSECIDKVLKQGKHHKIFGSVIFVTRFVPRPLQNVSNRSKNNIEPHNSNLDMVSYNKYDPNVQSKSVMPINPEHSKNESANPVNYANGYVHQNVYPIMTTNYHYYNQHEVNLLHYSNAYQQQYALNSNESSNNIAENGFSQYQFDRIQQQQNPMNNDCFYQSTQDYTSQHDYYANQEFYSQYQNSYVPVTNPNYQQGLQEANFPNAYLYNNSNSQQDEQGECFSNAYRYNNSNGQQRPHFSDAYQYNKTKDQQRNICPDMSDNIHLSGLNHKNTAYDYVENCTTEYGSFTNGFQDVKPTEPLNNMY